MSTNLICPTCGNKKISSIDTEWKKDNCLCYQQHDLFQKYVLANIPQTFWYKDFSDLNIYDFISKLIVPYINNFNKDNYPSLYLYNSVSNQTPSFIAVIMLKEILKKGFTGKYLSFQDFLTEIPKNILIDYDLIVIDSINLFTLEFLNNTNTNFYKFLNMLSCRRKPIIFSSTEKIVKLIPNEVMWKKYINFYVNTKSKQVEVPDLTSYFSIDIDNNLNNIFEGKDNTKKIK